MFHNTLKLNVDEVSEYIHMKYTENKRMSGTNVKRA